MDHCQNSQVLCICISNNYNYFDVFCPSECIFTICFYYVSYISDSPLSGDSEVDPFTGVFHCKLGIVTNYQNHITNLFMRYIYTCPFRH